MLRLKLERKIQLILVFFCLSIIHNLGWTNIKDYCIFSKVTDHFHLLKYLRQLIQVFCFKWHQMALQNM